MLNINLFSINVKLVSVFLQNYKIFVYLKKLENFMNE